MKVVANLVFLLISIISVSAWAVPGDDKYNDADVIYANFKMTKYIAALDRYIVSSGKTKLSRAYGICWKVQKPLHKVMYITKKGLKNINPGVTDADSLFFAEDSFMSDMSVFFLDILLKEDRKLYRDFVLNRDLKHEILLLTPRSANLALFVKSIEVKYKNELIDEITFLENSNSYTKILFSDLVVTNEKGLSNEVYCHAYD